jgi:hypothetical protein
MNSEFTRLKNIILADPERVEVLEFARDLNLPDWAIGAGFVRNAVWDHLHGYEFATPLNDIDVLYFNPGNTEPEAEREIEHALTERCLTYPWSVRNQARMHMRNGDTPYRSTEHAIAHWLETATSVGVRINATGQFSVLAPHRVRDLSAMRLASAPSGIAKFQEYQARIKSKNWQAHWQALWPQLRVDPASMHPFDAEIDSVDKR